MQDKKIWAPILKIHLKFSKSCHRQSVYLRAIKFHEQKNMCFIHVHTKFQLSSFIRSGDIANLLLGVFFSKIPVFQKNAVFVYKSKSAISLLLIKLESWNLVCIGPKYILLIHEISLPSLQRFGNGMISKILHEFLR